MIAVQAPGKVVLLGEYAVLDGAPAVVAAVDCGVVGRFAAGPELHIVAPDTRFVGPALHAAPPGTYTFTAWNPTPTATKPGLGSSAAATVAAVALRARAVGEGLDAERLFAEAARVHRDVQGSGSGIDVAASTFGGLLTFQDGQIRRSTLDLNDRLGVAWVGSSAATAPRIATYRAAVRREAFVRRSAELVATWEADPVPAFAEAARLLAALDRQIGLEWWVDAYGPLLELARDFGGAAKPSGAGGGDVVVAVFPDQDRRDAWRSAVRRAGAVPLPLAIAPGAHSTHEQ